MVTHQIDSMPAIRELKDFDRNSGNRFERLVFNHRLFVIVACVLATLLLGWQATRLSLNAAFEKTIPHHQPYIQNFLEHREDLKGLGNAVRVVVENKSGDIFDTDYLQALKQINDELFLTPGVDRAGVKSLWMPVVRWNEVTEEGFTGGPVMPDNYKGSARASSSSGRTSPARRSPAAWWARTSSRAWCSCRCSTRTRAPARRSTTGSCRGGWKKSAPSTARRTARPTSRSASSASPRSWATCSTACTQVMAVFGVAAVIAALVIYGWTRCVRSTFLVLACSLIAVLWQLGLVTVLGYQLDPYSILVPFLVFAIGVSHGAQKMNGIMQDVGRGTHKLVAARYTFRRLFLVGFTALAADAVGFAVLMIIDIPVIRELAITASLGVAVLVLTNLVLLPVMLSYTGVSPVAAARSLRAESRGRRAALWRLLERFTERRWAVGIVLASALMATAGFAVSTRLKIGDLDAGAPELRPDSRYNLDNAYITSRYTLSSDQFAVIVKTPPKAARSTRRSSRPTGWPGRCSSCPACSSPPRSPTPCARSPPAPTRAAASGSRISPNQDVLNYAARTASITNPELLNNDCSVMPVLAYLADHKAETLDRVVKAADEFARAHSTPERQFLLAAGSAGIEAATNIVVRQANLTMLLYVYAAVIVLCFITFRSWRAVVVAVVPLAITSVLCEALMVMLGMGVKVATLPVIALGVGIGVDYALYMLSIQLAQQRAGASLKEAYGHALRFTGKVVALVGVTLAAGVITWAWSPIKFQADMGILLTFMFVWNMLGALVLIPALSHFLLACVGRRIHPHSTPVRHLPSQLGKESARLDDVGHLHGFGDCIERRRQQLCRLRVPSLPGPEPRQAGRRSQLEQHRSLRTRALERLLERALGLIDIAVAAAEQDLGLDAPQIGLAPELPRALGFDDGLLDEGLRLLGMSAGGEGAGLHGR